MRLHHVGITVPNLDTAIAFFQGVLGFEQVLRTKPGGPAAPDYAQAVRIPPGTDVHGLAILRKGNSLVELFQYGKKSTSTFPPNNHVGGHHIAFEVEDLDEVLERLTTAGGTQCGSPRKATAPEFRGMR